MEERSRVSPSEITRGIQPANTQSRPAESRPAESQDPEWVTEGKELLDPREIERQVAERRARKPNYLTGTVTSGGGGVKIPEDLYEVEVLRIEEGAIPDQYNEEDKNAMKDIWEWHFKIAETDKDYHGIVVRGISSRSLHETSKAYRWAGAILGHPLGAGERVDLVSLFGKKCRIGVKFNKGGFSTVDDVFKLSPRSATDR